MSGSEVDWQQIAIWVGGGAGGGIAALYAALRRPKETAEGMQPRGAAQVVASSFIEKDLLERLITALGLVNGSVTELNQHMRSAEQERHDAKIAREAAAEALMLEKLRRGANDCGPDSIAPSSWRPER